MEFNNSICQVVASTPTSITCVTSGLQGNMTAATPYTLQLAPSQVCYHLHTVACTMLAKHTESAHRHAGDLLEICMPLASLACLVSMQGNPWCVMLCRVLGCRPSQATHSRLIQA